MTIYFHDPVYDSPESIAHQTRKELQIAFRNFVADMRLPIFATINFNAAVPYQSAVRRLREFHQLMDRKMFGRRFYKLPPSKRIFFVAMPEHLETNLHFHLMIKVPAHKTRYFQSNAWFYLYRLMPSARIHIKLPENNLDLRKTTFYSSKDSFKTENFNLFIISTEFNYKTKTPVV